MDKGKVLELCMDVRHNRSSIEGQTVVQRKEELCALIAELMKNYDKNKYEINELIKENVNEVLKVKVNSALDIIADIAYIPHGSTKKWNIKNGKITISYEALGSEILRQKIYKSSITAVPKAVGAAIYVEWDDVLAGRAEAFTELVDDIADAILEEVMVQIQTALVAAMANAPTVNKYAGAFALAQLRGVCQTVSAYGAPVIVGTAVGLANITSDDGFKEAMSDNMKDELNQTGYIGKWEGKPILVLPNSFTTDANTSWILDNDYIYVIPVNADKPVKVCFEGGAEMLEQQNFDTGQIEKKTLQKFSVNVLQYHNLGLVTIS